MREGGGGGGIGGEKDRRSDRLCCYWPARHLRASWKLARKCYASMHSFCTCCLQLSRELVLLIIVLNTLVTYLFEQLVMAPLLDVHYKHSSDSAEGTNQQARSVAKCTLLLSVGWHTGRMCRLSLYNVTGDPCAYVMFTQNCHPASHSVDRAGWQLKMASIEFGYCDIICTDLTVFFFLFFFYQNQARILATRCFFRSSYALTVLCAKQW